MRIRPQLEVPNVKSGAPVVNQVQAGTQTHFDAALLQAAQIVSDSEPEAYGALSPKVQQALSSALEQLNQKTPSQLQALAKQPQGLAALTASLAQTDGLNTAQTAQLNKLLMLALPRLLAYKTNVEVPGQSPSAATTSTGGAQPGPQGGTPAVSAFPADFFSTLTGQAGLSGAPNFGAQRSSVQGSDSTAAATAGASDPGGKPSSVQGPATGQGFLFGAGQVGQAGAQSPLQGSQPSEVLPLETGAAPVFSVAVNSSQTSSAQGAASGGNGAGQNTAAQGATGSGRTGTAPLQGQGGALVSNENGTTDTGFPVLLDLDAQLMDSGAPLPIQAGSQVTLRGDGTWVLPEGASASSTAKDPAPASQAVPVQAPSTPGTQGQEPSGATEQGVLLGSVPQTSVPQASGQGGAQGDGQASQVQASGLEDPTFLQELADEVASEGSGGAAQGSGSPTQQSSQTAAQQGQATGNSQVLGSQQLVAQLPSMMQVAQSGSPQGPSVDGTAAGPSFDPRGAQGNSQASAAQGTAQQGAFGGALAAFGRNPMQSLADQTVQDYGAEKVLAQQISNALNEAGGANPGRLVIQLSPASLGDVQVDLSMVDGKLTAHLVTSQQDVRDVLARDLSGFKAGLESHGIIVNEVSVAVRSGVGDRNQGSPEQTSPNWWRDLPKTDPAELGTVPGGVSAYSANTAAGQQGFNALA